MSSSTNVSIMESVCLDFVQSGKTFTAYDVSREARKRGADERHYQMKSVVHQLYNHGMFPNYDRTLHNVGAAEPAYVYHPIGADISNFPNKNTNSSQNDTVVSQQDTAITNDTTCIQSCDKEGRLFIAPSLLKQINLLAGNIAHVYFINNKVIVQANAIPNINGHIYTINADGRLRIGPMTLSQLGSYKNSVDNVYQINFSGDSIVITLAD